MSTSLETPKLDKLQSLSQELWRVEPAATAVRLSRGQWKRYSHLSLLSEKIAASASNPLRLLVSIPPRHGKSELVSHWAPVWFLSNWPAKRVILVSYEADFAASWGRKARDSMMENVNILGTKVKEDVAATSAWETTAGGGMTTAGIGGPITGKGGDMILVDDPIKNWEEAQSVTFRQNLQDWWTSTLRTRLEPDGSIIVVMARWHREDLIGWLLAEAKEPWEYLAMPAIDLKGLPLWPERYSLLALRDTEQAVGPESWGSLYQQKPETVAGDCYFDVNVLTRLLTEAKDGSTFRPYVVARRYGAAIDPAGEGRERCSLSIKDCQTGIFVVDYTTDEAPDDFAQNAYRILEQYKFPLLGIEANGVGYYMTQKLKELGYPAGKLVYQDEKRTKVGIISSSNLRDTALADLAEGIRQGDTIVVSREAIKEMFSFIKHPKGKPGHAEGAFDDRVSSMCWANWVSKQVPRQHAEQKGLLRYGYA